MIKADLHLHTCYSHGKNTPFEMHAAALANNLDLIGFSEHSPRPAGYDYSHEYRDQLSAHLEDYVNQVTALKEHPGDCAVLLGMEIDWLSNEREFVGNACRAFDFDYLIGSVHFLDHWGFDDGAEPWREASQEQCDHWYGQYFHVWREMLGSGLFQIAAHPDLIKIYSRDQFHAWLDRPENLLLVRNCLVELRNSGMAMEISSAGLHKACQEIYPCPQIMKMAAELELPVSLASDAHCVEDVCYGFDALAGYAKSFGFTTQAVYQHGKKRSIPF